MLPPTDDRIPPTAATAASQAAVRVDVSAGPSAAAAATVLHLVKTPRGDVGGGARSQAPPPPWVHDGRGGGSGEHRSKGWRLVSLTASAGGVESWKEQGKDEESISDHSPALSEPPIPGGRQQPGAATSAAGAAATRGDSPADEETRPTAAAAATGGLVLVATAAAIDPLAFLRKAHAAIGRDSSVSAGAATASSARAGGSGVCGMPIATAPSGGGGDKRLPPPMLNLESAPSSAAAPSLGSGLASQQLRQKKRRVHR